jgi:hypothetical protein
VSIQSDESAIPYMVGYPAEFLMNVTTNATLDRMPQSRAVLSVSPVNDVIHDRTMNALNAGCVAIVEDSPIHREVFEHGRNALLFRFGDDSLRKCLDIVCNQAERAFAIAQAGMKLRHDPRFRFGEFGNILSLAQRQSAALRSSG